ncbi:hypothetical protein V5F40_19390 [Xanthobacter sp. DSM 14520]|uniref:tetratricopeptide repeat protein n=1 Tax=Xanthobacter autotrophicus (strain ATCC BAA-1158 / Py2) TaxID=78245 RepID=UPI003727C455
MSDKLLMPYCQLSRPDCELPLHSEATALSLEGEAAAFQYGLVLCGMWSPVGYAQELNDILGTSEDFAARLANWGLNAVISGRVAATTSDLAVLSRLGMYREIATIAAIDGSILTQFLRSRARLLSMGGGWKPFKDWTCFRSYSTFELHAMHVLEIASAQRQGNDVSDEIERAATFVERGLGVPDWCSSMAMLRIESLRLGNGVSRETSRRLRELAAQALELSEAGRVSTWLSHDYARHRLARAARVDMALGADATSTVDELIATDPLDARAWELRAHAYRKRDESVSFESLKTAALLDPTVAKYVADDLAHLSRKQDRSAGSLFWKARNAKAARARTLDLELVSGVEARELKEWLAQPQATRAHWLAFLYSPVLELGQERGGPIFCKAPSIAFERMTSQSPEAGFEVNIQRAVMPETRVALCQAAGRGDLAIVHPREVPLSLRNDRWSTLVDTLAKWDDLSTTKKVAAVGLLLSLGLYKCAFDLLRNHNAITRGVCWETRHLEAFVEYILFAGSGWFAYQPTRFIEVAKGASVGSRAKFTSLVVLGVHAAKYDRDVAASANWFALAREALAPLRDRCPIGFSNIIWESRLLRAEAFVPFLRGDFEHSIEILQKSLELSEDASADCVAQGIARAENIQTIRQTLSKTFCHAGRLEDALSSSRAYVDCDPCDGGGHLELGDILLRMGEYNGAIEHYTIAASLGPPGSFIGHFMAGECFSRMGKENSAAIELLFSIDSDPEGTSPRRALADLLERRALEPLTALVVERVHAV